MVSLSASDWALPCLSPKRMHPLRRMGRDQAVFCKRATVSSTTAGHGLAGRMSSAAKFCIDATLDALNEMERGNLAVTVFQDRKAQGGTSAETSPSRLPRPKRSIPFVWVRFQLITRNNCKAFPKKERVSTIDACRNIMQEAFI